MRLWQVRMDALFEGVEFSKDSLRRMKAIKAAAVLP